MNPLIGALGPLLKDIIGTVINKLPMTQGEKIKAENEIDLALTQHAGTIAEAEAKMSETRSTEWIADATAKSWLANNWRPLTGITGTLIILWEGILINLVNAGIFYFSGQMPIPHAPSIIVDSSMWVLLALVGVRSAEKITAINKSSPPPSKLSG